MCFFPSQFTSALWLLQVLREGLLHTFQLALHGVLAFKMCPKEAGSTDFLTFMQELALQGAIAFEICA